MKYIVTRSEEGLEEIFIFCATINHDAMAEVIECIKNRTREPWHRVYRRPVSAGFVNAAGLCHGNSESLRLASRPEDTKLLQMLHR